MIPASGNMLETIGNSPLVKLTSIPEPGMAEIWVKIEGTNSTGSYKDRMALAMVKGAEQEGRVNSSTIFLECTGGSTGTALAFVCAVKGHALTIISSDAYAREIGRGGTVVTVACDSGYKYLMGGLFS